MSEQRRHFKRVLIANRGEIAVRIARTLREMGIAPVAVYSDVDRPAPHVRACDLAFCIGTGPASESYLRTEAILDVARKAGVDAIHPGYGFLSENAAFAKAVEAAGIRFIGPPAHAMEVMGSKTSARAAMQQAGVPTVPGTPPVESVQEAASAAEQIGYPVIVKASAGGGGKGMRLVQSPADLASAFRAARSEATNAFGDDTVYLEKAIVRPHHVEVQILSGPDSRTVWLGERECSMQRRHQKVIEETPSPIVKPALRKRMGEVACRAAEAVGYVGAGTVEFLVDDKRNFYFLEMNTRLQVEHPVTELCCGIDLVEAQVRIAQGEPLPWQQKSIVRKGHAIEARIYAEDPDKGFLPCPGRITHLILPHGPGVRVDCGVASGSEISRYYDPMVAKIIVWAEDRERARRRLVRALRETAVKGLVSNISFLRRIVQLEAFQQGDYDTSAIDAMLEAPPSEPPIEVVDVAVAAGVVSRFKRDRRAAGEAATAEAPAGSMWRSRSWRWGDAS